MRMHSPFLRPVAGLVAAMALCASGPAAMARNLVYTATVVTDIKVGDHSYHNASVSIAFTGNTRKIKAVTDGAGNALPSLFCSAAGDNGYAGDGLGYFSYLADGVASVSVTSRGHTLVAQLAPGQVFVALDSCNGGIGFGAFIGPGGLEPAYPVAFTLGTAMAVANGTGLSVPTAMSGNAWTCIGYPPSGAGVLPETDKCASPDPYPLHSDQGDIFFYSPYMQADKDGNVYGNHIGALNRGTFTISPAPGGGD
jgi:hypothetical protein